VTHEQAIENLNRLLDGELDESLRHEVEEHAAACPSCMALRRAREALSEALGHSSLHFRAPDGLAEKVMAKVAPQPAWNFVYRWARLTAAAAVIALAIASSLAWLAPLPGGDPTYQYVIDCYKRSTAAGGLVDFPIADNSAVNRWVRLCMSLPSPIRVISSGPCRFSGVRMDKVGEQQAAVLVYRTGGGEFDLFEWPDSSKTGRPLMTDQIRGYTVSQWSKNGTQYWLVTATHDKSVADQRILVQLLTEPTTAPPATRS